MTTRRKFLTTAALGGAGTLAAPAIVKAQTPIKWRFQTYAGAALGEHVTKPAIDYINNAANGEMEIELFYADQIVPTGELFRALQTGTIDAATINMPVSVGFKFADVASESVYVPGKFGIIGGINICPVRCLNSPL